MGSGSSNVLLIDDDQRLGEMIRELLESAGYSVAVALDGKTGLALQRSGNFDIVILDLMLPDIDGLEICRSIRAGEGVPILMLTAKGGAVDRIIGLEMGADDYLPKPFEPRELIARIRAVLRRGARPHSSGVLRFGRLDVDRDAMEARLDGVRCELTPYQFQLLVVLADGAGRVLSRDQLMQSLQGTDLEAFDRSIDVHVSRIRSEIEDNPKQPKRVITVRGAGYVFAKTQD